MKTTCKAKFTATRLQRRFSRELNSTPHLTRCIWPVPRPRPLIGKYFLKNIWPAKRRLQLLTDGNACGVRAQTTFQRRNGTQHVEKRGIGRNLKVEVEETVNQDASNAQSCRERRSAIHVVHPFADLLGRPAINDDEKPEHHDKSEPSHLHQQLQVVIMRGVYKKIGIEAAKLRIYIRKHPQPPSYNRFKCEHLQPIASDVEPCSTRQLCSRFGSDTGHTPGQLASLARRAVQ